MEMNPRYVKVVLGTREIWDEEGTWESLADDLRDTPTPWLLGVLGWVSRTLHSTRLSDSDLHQMTILRGLFGEEAEELWTSAWRAWERLDPQHTGKGFVLFTEAAILNLLKVVLLKGNTNSSSESGNPRELGKALLSVSSILGTGPMPSRGGAPASEKEWILYFLANSLFHFHGNELHEYARTSLLYFRGLRIFDLGKRQIDLPRRFAEVVGLRPAAYWALHSALASRFSNSPDKPLIREDLDQYFSKTSTASELAALRDWSVSSLEDLTRSVRGEYTLQELKPYHVLPFAQKPFIELDGHIYCPSVALARSKLTHGPYHAFLDRSRTTHDQRERFLEFNGRLFERYIESIFNRMFPPTSGRFLSEADLRQAAGSDGKICDGAIVYPNAVLLVETKASRFSLLARTAMDWHDCAGRIEDIFVDSAEQLTSSMRMLQEGRFAQLGLTPASCPRAVPVIITAEDVVMNEILGCYVDDRVRTSIGDWPRGLAPIQVVNVGELELVEVAVDDGANLLEWLEEKVRAPTTRHIPLLNYLHTIGHSSVHAGHNPTLAAEFMRLSEEAVATLERRMVDP